MPVNNEGVAKQEELSLLYIWDAYCGWCYGFSKELGKFHHQHPEIPLQLISGGLFVGENKKPLSAFPAIKEANQRITAMRGVTFGSAFEQTVAAGSLVLDSEFAAQGFASLSSAAPDQAFELGKAMQHAFYQEGKSLSAATTYSEIATEFGLDAEAVVAGLTSAATVQAAQQDFTMAHQFGVTSFPTLLIQKHDQFYLVGGSSVTARDIERALQQIE